MIDPRDYPAFWGFCGGVLGGLADVITAHSRRAGDPLARRRSWYQLALGVVGGPIMAEAFVVALAVQTPLIGSKGLALFIGMAAANDPRWLYRFLKGIVTASLEQALKQMKGGSDERS